jgi:hypothetical protein
LRAKWASIGRAYIMPLSVHDNGTNLDCYKKQEMFMLKDRRTIEKLPLKYEPEEQNISL